MFPALVDEVDGVFGEGPEDFKTLMNQASSPLTMSMKPSLRMSYGTILLLQRNHDGVVTTLMVCHRTSSLILALFMTLPLLELCWWVVEICYSRWLRKVGQGYAWKETSVV